MACLLNRPLRSTFAEPLMNIYRLSVYGLFRKHTDGAVRYLYAIFLKHISDELTNVLFGRETNSDCCCSICSRQTSSPSATRDVYEKQNYSPIIHLLLDFSLSVKAAPHECVIRTGQL